MMVDLGLGWSTVECDDGHHVRVCKFVCCRAVWALTGYLEQKAQDL